MKKHFALISCAVVLYGCCTKKKCGGPELPEITVKFSNLEPMMDNRVVLYTFESGVMTDSSVTILSKEQPLLGLFPFRSFKSDPERSFVIKWQNGQEEISHPQADFRKDKIKCNSCFPFGDGSETIDTFSNFTYQHGNETFHRFDTLFLSW